ncbi:MAG: hypothetical protein Q9211_000715, partial [Gyalolechia sp. 1 TL-2023]
MQRLRNFPPNLSDLIVVTSTASTDVGLFTRSDIALTSDAEAEKVTKVFTTTTMANDTRRAQLPMAEDSSDTSPIGMAIDLSSTEKVPRPLPGEEMDESTGPLPLLMILNNEGLLTSWWIVYAESIRQGTTYPGLVAAGVFQAQTQKVPGATRFTTSTAQPTSASITSGTFGSPQAPSNTFSNPAASNAYGGTGMNSAFGASSALGSKPSVWGSSSGTGGISQNPGTTFGKPTFGSSPQIGGTFGAPGDIGSRPSPWAAPSAGAQTGGSSFGQTGNLGMGAGSTFGSNVNNPFKMESSGGFANFAARPGFAEAAAAANPNAASHFAKPGEGNPFGSGMDTDTIFGVAPKKPEETTPGLFGVGAAGGQFKLGSTFKGDGTLSTDAAKPAMTANDSMFGGDFANTLGETQKLPSVPVSKEADMDEGGNEDEHEAMSEASANDRDSSTPAAKPKPSLFNSQQTAPPLNGGLFGTQAQSDTSPAMVQKSAPAAALQPQSPLISTTPEDTPKKSEDAARPSIESVDQSIKTEPQDNSPSGISEDIPDEPLPPDTTSKVSYSPGNTSQSSASGSKVASGDAPLPPDFLSSTTERKRPELKPEETALSEEDDSGLDDEGSGVDVAQEISPTTDSTRTPKITPGSSFGAPINKSPDGLFSLKGQPHTHTQSKALFGEIGVPSQIRLPPPSVTQESPRSPSPVRSRLAVDNLRPDNARSISAPSASVRKFPSRKFGAQPSNPLTEPQPSLDDLQKRERERFDAQRARRAPEELQDLSDQQDDQIVELLNA